MSKEKKMTKHKVISILEFYRDVDKAVKLNASIIKNLEDQYYYGIGSPRLDGLPGAKGGKSNPTETAALNIPSTVRKTIRDIEKENAELEKVKTAILKEINSLNYIQKSIVFSFYVEGHQWERISGRINYSVRQCQNIRNNALDKLASKFSRNTTVARFKFPAK